MGTFSDAAGRIGPLDQAAAAETARHHDRLTKPKGSLGRLESIGVQLAGICGSCPPSVPSPAAVAVFAGDHGVLSEGVSPWPQEVTAQMVANFCSGGAAINVLARHCGAEVVVVDVGVASDIPVPDGAELISAKVRRGTRNFLVEDAMTKDEAIEALDVGASVADTLVSKGMRALVTGDMGIGNTTPSAALIAVVTGRPPEEVAGRGTGINDADLAHKIEVIARGIERAKRESGDDPLSLLASLGGFEIAALAGFVAGGAAARVPVLIDGVIAAAGALVASLLAPGCVDYCIAGHRSTEPGSSIALDHLGLDPVVDLELRLGEGTGACLALPVLQAAAKISQEMATFDSAGVSEKTGTLDH
ncbi:MAG: nicotinate-nucleotide--dimethylbenzimidazole phosphoribosyltransferase [Acidimicrobiales bacterium]